MAYAIEAAARALGGPFESAAADDGVVIGIIALVTLNYWQLVRAFPEGGGSPEAAGRAFGEEWSFLPIGALVVDFALTIAAAGSAIIAYVPGLAPARIPLALGLVALVAALTWFGHGGRMIFAVMTCLFIVAVAVLALGWVSPDATHGHPPITGSASPALIAVVLAFPVAMALATGTEAPATSIAQLGQLENRGRARFGRGTLALTVGIVGVLTMGLTALAVHLHVGVPRSDSTQIADLARTAAGGGGCSRSFSSRAACCCSPWRAHRSRRGSSGAMKRPSLIAARPASATRRPASAVLGSDHPLAQAIDALESVVGQLRAVAAVLTGSMIALSEGRAWPPAVAISAAIVLFGLIVVAVGFEQRTRSRRRPDSRGSRERPDRRGATSAPTPPLPADANRPRRQLRGHDQAGLQSPKTADARRTSAVQHE